MEINKLKSLLKEKGDEINLEVDMDDEEGLFSDSYLLCKYYVRFFQELSNFDEFKEILEEDRLFYNQINRLILDFKDDGSLAYHLVKIRIKNIISEHHSEIKRFLESCLKDYGVEDETSE